MTTEAHRDVASYALGVLDDRDMTRFEEHLVDCPACAAELESLLPVVDLLGDVDGHDLAVAEQYDTDSAHFERVLTAVTEDRRKARSRSLYTLAAGVVLLASLTGLGLFVGTQVSSPDPGRSPGVVAEGEPTRGGRPTPEVGGPGLPEGDQLSGTDRESGVQAEFIVAEKGWGTQVSMALRGLAGPRVCQLVLISDSGETEVLASWRVPPAGYGTPAQPQPLTLQSATASQRAKFDQLQVQELTDDGRIRPLVTVPI